MTHLRKMMLEELQRRHYSEATTQRYIRFIERFAQHFHCSPDRLGPKHIREYQAQLFTVHKLTPGSVTNHLCALRFLYIQTLKRPWSIADTPYPKKRYRLPTILSQEEVTQLIDAAPTPFYRTILMTLYGTGVRRNELTRLKVSDIDSRRMVVHIQGGKGGQDRDVMLSPALLEELRAHWRRLRGNRWHSGDHPPIPRLPTAPAPQPLAAPGSRSVSIPTCSATASPRTCSNLAPTSTPVATYMQALTEMIDVAEKRLAAFESRVPKTVWLIIFIVAIFQSFATGFSLKRRFWFSLVMTPLVIAVVMALLADLDSPRTGQEERHSNRSSIL
ncbi:MAG TPA: phage integrase N-terminal SAM-like domain-containing protein [Terracidiphilus sp.]